MLSKWSLWLKGKRTFLFSGLVTVTGLMSVFEVPEVHDFVATNAPSLLTGIGVTIAVLRFLTTASVFKK